MVAAKGRTLSQEVRLVNGRLVVPLRVSDIEERQMKKCSNFFITEHTWHPSSSQSGALRLEKSKGKIANPDTSRTVLGNGKKVETQKT